MTTVATLDTVMRLDSAAFRTGMVQAATQANKSLGSIQAQAKQTASVLLELKRAAGVLGSLYLVKEGFGALVDAQKQLQAIEFTFLSATGSMTKGAEAFDFVRQEAEKIGLSLPEAAEGFAKLSASANAAGVSMDTQRQLFDAYAKSVTTLHLSSDQANRALLALEQMFAKGKVQAQELRLQLAQAIPGAALRFQNAVMEMTKGTELAGKSFDQLLKGGDLVVSRFAPALVTALQQTATGWEQASHSLNANLNRVSTAWFNLKAQTSQGLFNDAVTAGAGLLADNLARIASTLTVIGVAALARMAGTQVGSAASAVALSRQKALGAQLAADAETQYATSVVNSAKAELAAANEQVRLMTLRKEGAAAALASAQEEAAAAATRLDTANATLQHQSGAAVLSSNLRAQQEAQAAQIAAEAKLAKSRVTANAAAAGGVAAEADLAKARARATVATEAQIAATRSLAAAEAEEAVAARAASVGATLARGVASLGNFAMGLAGGPWGLAAIAIGGVSYAIYKVIAAQKEYQTETDNQVKSLQAQAAAAQAAAAAYGTLDSSMTASQAADTYKTTLAQADKVRQEIADLQKQAQDLRDQDAARMASTPSINGAGAMGLNELNIARINDRIKELQAQLPAVTQQAGALGNELSGVLAVGADKVNDAIGRLASSNSLGSFLSNLKSAYLQMKEVSQAQRDAIAAAEQGQKDVQSAESSISGLVERANKDVLTKGVGYVAQAKAELAVGIAGIKAQRLSAEKEAGAIAELQDKLAKGMSTLRAADVKDNAKKNASAINAQAEQYKSLIAQINSRIEQDKEAADTTSNLTAAQKLQIKVEQEFAAGKTKLSKSMQAEIEKMLAVAVAQGNATRATLAQIDADKRLATLKDQLNSRAANQARENQKALEGVGHGTQWNQQNDAINQIIDDYTRMRDAEDRAFNELTPQQRQMISYLNEHKEAIEELNKAQDEAIAKQYDFFKAEQKANASYSNGVNAAIEDFMTTQQNNKKIAQDFTTNFLGGFANSLAAFGQGVGNAKKAFTDWIDTMYQEAWQFLANKAIQALIDSFGNGQNATPGSTQGGWGSIVGNFINALGSGGGKASGGAVAPYSSYRVAENGPEVLRMGDRAYLLTGGSGGTVEPNHSLQNGAGMSQTFVTNVNVQPTSTRRTADQVARAVGQTQRIAMSRM